jgi:epsilon-lactone hydrolase
MTQNSTDIVRDMYLEWTANRIKGTPSDLEAWGDVTAEPRGVDYVELDAAGLLAMWAVPKGCDDDRTLLCMHGGGFVGGSIYTHRKLFAHVAKAVGVRALVFEYRLAPEHIHPAQVDDATDVYQWLIEEHEIDPAHVAFAGDSSGGGLAMSVQLRARERGLRLPAAALLMSPWVDMEQAGESYRSNWATETFFYKEVVDGLADTFLGTEGDPTDPLASPIEADLHGLAPPFIQVGGDETLLDDSRALAERAIGAGVETKLEVFAGQQHTFQMAAGRSVEADEAIAMFARWLRPKLGLSAAVAVAVGG